PHANVVARMYETRSQPFKPVSLSWPPAANANSYEVYTTCPLKASMNPNTTTSTSITVQVESWCSSAFDVFLYARDTANNFAPQGAMQTPVSGGTVVITTPWSALADLPAQYAHLPANLSAFPQAYASSFATETLPATTVSAINLRTLAADGTLTPRPW